MNRRNLPAFFLIVAICAFSTVRAEPPALRPNPFFAMDTAYRRDNLTHAEQLDLVKELGFAGVSEDVQPAEKMKASLAEIEARGLKLFAIYASARVTPDGDIAVADDMPAIMEILKGHDTIVWLHIGGKGPAFDSLTGNEPMIGKLRQLSSTAKADGLRVAVYPHLGEWTAHFADATKLAKIINHDALGVTFNLGHCLANGDGDQIPALISEAGKYLLIATINGADAGVKGGDWSKLIQPLGAGTFDTKIVLTALDQIHFAGPVGFQGYGIKGEPREILKPTIKAWRAILASPHS